MRHTIKRRSLHRSLDLHAVVLDIDGTLLQSTLVDVALHRKSVESVVGRVRFRPNLEDYDCVTDTGILLQVLDDNSIEARPHTIELIKRRFLGGLEEHVVESGAFAEIPGARSFVERLKKSEHHVVAIATGCWRLSAKLKLETAGFDISDIPLATADDAIDRRDIMRIALTNLGREFDTITYYGDGIWDKAASRSLGWEFQAVGPELEGIQSYDDAVVA